MSRAYVELAPDDPRHGTTNGYGNLGCRCSPCTEAHRQNHSNYMRKVRDTRALVNSNASHGTSYRYDVGCRCDDCREAHNAKSRDTKQRIRERRARGEQSVAKPGSEAAHEEKLRELAGPEAEWVFSAPKKYPKLDADAIQRQTAEGNVCLVNEGDLRVLLYRQGSEIHGLVTELAHGGYRRRYRKVSGSASDVVASLWKT